MISTNYEKLIVFSVSSEKTLTKIKVIKMKKLLLAASIAALTLGGSYAEASVVIPSKTITQTISQGMTLTDWSKSFNILKFNPDKGTLNSVTITQSASSNVSASLTNKGTTKATKVAASVESLVNLEFDIGGLAQLYNTADASLNKHILGDIVYTETKTTGEILTTAEGYSHSYTDATTLSYWTGLSSLSGLLKTDTGFSVGGKNTSNVEAIITNFSASNFSVVYDYTPSSVPVPAAAWLFGTGLVGLIGMSNRKKASATQALAA